jgi:hypothetical protein
MKLKKLICLLLAGLMMMPLLVACNGGSDVTPNNRDDKEPTGDEPTGDEPTGDEPEKEVIEALPKNKKYRILFIGNSYTKRNNMTNEIFKPMAEAAGYDVEVTAILNGGHTLLGFADPNDTYGAQVARELSAANLGKYDYVVIQEQSLRPITDTGKFYDGARALVKKIKAIGATPVLYSHWGRKTGSADLTDLNLTNESMTWKLAGVAEAIGEELDMPVAYAGLAFFDVYTNAPRIELYDDDLYHPVYNGSYLIAATIFARIFGVDPTTVAYDGSMRPNYAEVLREAAKNAVFNTPEIPSEYKTKSEGVVGETIDTSMMRNITKIPNKPLISVLTGERFQNGKVFSGILGTKGQIASLAYSTTGFSDEQKADIADIGYGVSFIGVEKINSSKGEETAFENLVNGHWGGTGMMTNITFDDKLYDVNGNAVDNGKYRALITLNFGKVCSFSAYGFASGSMNGFPGAADVYVSTDGVNWTLVPSACYDKINGAAISPCSDSSSFMDKWSGSATDTVCLFDMAEVEGIYVRIGVVIGRCDKATMYNTINTREILVFGEYK